MANFIVKLKTDTKSLYNIKYGVFLRKILQWGKKLNTRIIGNIWEQTEVKIERKINYRSF